MASSSKKKITDGHVTADEVLDVIKELRKEKETGEVPVSKEEVELYNKVNQACSSRLSPEIKFQLTKKLQGRVEELSRGVVSSDGTDEESGSETTLTAVAKKDKSAQRGKGKKGGKSKKKNKRGW
ncbi:hypothetical protein RhiirA5_420518 [Rhizophagus irregularis]|uniref:Uncharacterized protein n=1 Tax=Rhizophagus irregularis TaxID=588596 RepID=A0A2N0PFZ1_9GLOM|nr:hypothetical protein RhiirA5_420518 [Rhizophagus irregularis]